MDIWVPLLSDRLESPNFEFITEFIGGKCVIQKDYLDDVNSTKQAGWIIHVYFRPEQFEDRPFIADVAFRCGTQRREVMSVLIKNDSLLGFMRIKEKTGRLIVAARIRKLLCELDLSKPSGSRQFIVQNFENQVKEGLIFYVNLSKLNQYGGDLFKKWQTIEDVQNISTTTELMENKMIEALMEATAKYDDLIVLRHSFHMLIQIAQKFRMHKLMRAVEEFLSETKLMSWDEKILLALQYRMSLLYVQVQRKYLLTQWNILCRIQRLYITNYANQSQNSSNPYDLIHKNLVQMLMMTDENICIG
uniref:MI domain-containing protein n=1 Tax=Caenorhabditis tropicalis TaxID=1561998 RepID=A0A1I7TG62_9PELO